MCPACKRCRMRECSITLCFNWPTSWSHCVSSSGEKVTFGMTKIEGRQVIKSQQRVSRIQMLGKGLMTCLLLQTPHSTNWHHDVQFCSRPAPQIKTRTWRTSDIASGKSCSPETDFIEAFCQKTIREEAFHCLVEMTSDASQSMGFIWIQLAPEEDAVLGQSLHPEHGVREVDVVWSREQGNQTWNQDLDSPSAVPWINKYFLPLMLRALFRTEALA